MRTPTRHIIRTLLLLTITTILATQPTPTLAAGEAPIKENVASHSGWEVNETTDGTLCTVLSGDKCQPAKQSAEPGGFEDSEALAVNDDPSSPDYHDVYVADLVAGRIDVLSSAGQYISSFGIRGQGTGQFDGIEAMTVDPANGNVFVSETQFHNGTLSGWRVQELTAEGTFVLEVGREVNETTRGNVCTEEEVKTKSVKCTTPTSVVSADEHDGFTEASALAFGPGDILYVGEPERIQELEVDGKYKGEIPLSLKSGKLRRGGTRSLAVASNGDVYLLHPFFEEEVEREFLTEIFPAGIIYELEPNGTLTGEFKLTPRDPGANVAAQALALDPAGRLAVAEYEEKEETPLAHRGVLYDVTTGHLRPITEFMNTGSIVDDISTGIQDLAFDDEDAMFATDFYFASAGYFATEMITYAPVLVGELLTDAAACKPGTEHGSNATLDCALNGEVNPWEVADSEAWFKWGLTSALGERTATQSVCTSGCGQAFVTMAPTVVAGLRPNETVYYQLDGEDARVKSPEVLSSETASFQTDTVAPRIVGHPSVSFVKPFSVVLSGEVNPENANTSYAFQYASAPACEALEAQDGRAVVVEECPGMVEAQAGRSSEYGNTAAAREASGLQPSTSYRYRLFAKNTAGGAMNETGGATLPEAVFTTAPAPVPQALTGAASAIGSTSAMLLGSVDADGQPAVYTLELGVYAGSATQYGIVLSATAGADSMTIEQAVSGLQPGTTYAYRVSISSEYVPDENHTLYGTPGTFTTLGAPAVLSVPSVLAQLPIPAIAIPEEAVASKPKITHKAKKTKGKEKKGKGKARKRSKSKARKGGK